MEEWDDITLLGYDAESTKYWRWKQSLCPKRWYLPASLQGFITRKNNVAIFTAVRTSHLTRKERLEIVAISRLLTSSKAVSLNAEMEMGKGLIYFNFL
jgi:hypothetical protein